MKHALRKVSLGLWFAPLLVSIIVVAATGFDFENLGAVMLIHNGLNPWAFHDHANALLIGTSAVLSLGIIAYIWSVKPNKAGDVVLLVFVIACYVIGGIRFIANFTV